MIAFLVSNALNLENKFAQEDYNYQTIQNSDDTVGPSAWNPSYKWVEAEALASSAYFRWLHQRFSIQNDAAKDEK